MENLEYQIRIPEKSQLNVGMVICHPHPLYKGDFWNDVVRKIEKYCSQIIPTLRFNFRGAGASSGTYNDGIGEKKDVKQMVGVLMETWGTGFSLNKKKAANTLIYQRALIYNNL